jgi:hypothetical protein
MDYLRRELSLTLRRCLAALLGLTLLVAFWSDRPSSAASVPSIAGAAPATIVPPRPIAGVSLLRRPWLALYAAIGAPPLTGAKLSEDEEARFRNVVGTLAASFFLLGAALWWRGSREIEKARAP